MEINPLHLKWIEELPTGSDERSIMIALAWSGDFQSRQDLVRRVFSHDCDDEPTNNSRLDRRIRQAISNLRNAGIPIMSSSAGKGYWLAKNADEVEAFIAELESRRERMAEEIRAMRLMKDRINLVKYSQTAVQERLV